MDPSRQYDAALQGLMFNAQPIPPAALDQTPRNLARLCHHMQCGAGTKGNEFLTSFIGEASATPQGRHIKKSLTLIPNSGRELSIKCLNPDDSEYGKVLAQKPRMPLVEGKAAADLLTTKISLNDILLPPALAAKLSTPFKVINTVQDWLQSQFSSRVDFSGPIKAEASSFCMSIPASAKTGKADFVPQIKVGNYETWLFVVFNRSGDHYSIQGMEFHGGETTHQLQAGENHNQKDWSVFPFPAEEMRDIERSRPEIAEEFKKSCLVMVGVRLEKQHEYMGYRGGGVSKGVSLGGPAMRGGHLECASASAADYGIIAGGEQRAIHYGSSSYTGRYRLAGEAFICFGSALPVNFTSCVNDYNLARYIQSCDEAMDSASAMMEKMAPCLTKTELRQKMLAKVGQPAELQANVFLVRDNHGEDNPYLDLTGRVSVLSSNLALDGKEVVFYQDRHNIKPMYFYNCTGKPLLERMPTIFTWALKKDGRPSQKKVTVYDFDFHKQHYDVYIIDVATNILNLNMKRTVQVADMGLERLESSQMKI